MNLQTWENAIIAYMTNKGWKCDVNDEKRLGFVFYENKEKEWIRDYDKTTRRFIQFNGRAKINLVMVVEKQEFQVEENEKD